MSKVSRTISLLAQIHVTIEVDPEVEHEAGFAAVLDEQPDEIRQAMGQGLDALIRRDLDDPLVKALDVKVSGSVLPQ